MQNKTNRDDLMEIDLVEVFSLMLKNFWIIILSAVVAGAVAFSLSSFVITPQYESTTKVYILNRNDSKSNQLSYSDTQLATQLTKDYKELITCRYVLEKVIQICGLDDSYEDLQGRVSVSNTADTRIIGITVKDPNPANAQYIANSIRDVASEHIKAVMAIEAVNVVDEANLAVEPSEPSVLKWTAIGILLGGMLAASVILVKYLLDDTVKSSDDVEKYLGLSTLALIPVMQGESKKQSHSKKKEKTVEQKYAQPSLKEEKTTQSEESAIEELG